MSSLDLVWLYRGRVPASEAVDRGFRAVGPKLFAKVVHFSVLVQKVTRFNMTHKPLQSN